MICNNKRDGKQMASQKMLQLLHPNIKSWGSLVRMYGSKAISAQRQKKERENEVRSVDKVGVGLSLSLSLSLSLFQFLMLNLN